MFWIVKLRVTAVPAGVLPKSAINVIPLGIELSASSKTTISGANVMAGASNAPISHAGADRACDTALVSLGHALLSALSIAGLPVSSAWGSGSGHHWSQ